MISSYINVFFQVSYGAYPTTEVVGFAPALLIITLYVVVPTTIVVVFAAFAAPAVMSPTVTLLAYIVPIGAARVWLQGDAIEAVLQHQE
jgi:hypothetical protein